MKIIIILILFLTTACSRSPSEVVNYFHDGCECSEARALELGRLQDEAFDQYINASPFDTAAKQMWLGRWNRALELKERDYDEACRRRKESLSFQDIQAIERIEDVRKIRGEKR